MKKILVTGMSGLIGGLLRRHLEKTGNYQLTALNRRFVEGVDFLQADISDMDSIKPAFDGKDVVVHLAAKIENDSWEALQRSNITGTYNVYEAAVSAGVKRIIFASSGDAITGWELDPEYPYGLITSGSYDKEPGSWPMVGYDTVRPGNIYGATKIWGEALGRYYSDVHGISVVCLRLGAVRPENRPMLMREYSTYLSHRDVVELIRLCIDAPDSLRYDIFYGVSNNKWRYRDLERAQELLGFVPQDSADLYLSEA